MNEEIMNEEVIEEATELTNSVDTTNVTTSNKLNAGQAIGCLAAGAGIALLGVKLYKTIKGMRERSEALKGQPEKVVVEATVTDAKEEK